MAIQFEKNEQLFGASGVPTSDTDYDILDFGFKSKGVKIIVTAGVLEVSVNRTDPNPHMSLAVGQYDFDGLSVSKLFIRNTAATAQIIAWAG